MDLAKHLTNVIHEQEITDEFGIEGIGTFVEYIDKLITGTKEVFKTLVNEKFTGIEGIPIDVSVLDDLIRKEKISFNEILEMKLYRPTDMSGMMQDFTDVLNEELAKLSDIVERLYEPVNDWLAKAVMINDFEKKIWIDKKINYIDLDKTKRNIGNFFKVTRTSDVEDLRIGSELYGSMRQFTKTYENLMAIASVGKNIRLDLIERGEENLSQRVQVLISRENEDDNFELSRQNKKMLVMTLKAIADEVEYMASLCYIATQTITAWNDSIDKIKASAK